MKYFQTLIFLISTTISIYSQNEIELRSDGIYIPRIDRNSIQNPLTGHIVFDISTNQLWFYDGSTWKPVNTDAQTLAEIILSDNNGGFNQIKNILDPTEPNDVATKQYVDNNDDITDADSDITNELQNLSEVLAQGANAGFNRIVGLADPIMDQDAATKMYVDNNDDTGTDNQNISGSELSGTILTIGIEGGSSQQVDLATLQDGTGTDDQTLSEVLTQGADANMNRISNAADPTMDQDLATKKYVDDNDDIGTDDQTLSEVLTQGADANMNRISNAADPTMDQDLATKKYVDDNIGSDSDWTINGNDQYSGVIGNVGIGTNDPNEKLDVDGAINIGTTANSNNGTIRYTGTDFEGYSAGVWTSFTSGTSSWDINGTDIYYNETNGEVGIGTGNPTSKFHVIGNNDTGETADISTSNDLVTAADVLNIAMGAQSSDDAQFIECRRFADNMFRVNGNGSVYVGKDDKTIIDGDTGDVYVTDSAAGVILTSPNGNCWRITIDDTGTQVVTSVTCP